MNQQRLNVACASWYDRYGEKPIPQATIDRANGLRNQTAQEFMTNSKADVFLITAKKGGPSTGQQFIVMKNNAVTNVEVISKGSNPYQRKPASSTETTTTDAVKGGAAGSSRALTYAGEGLRILTEVGVIISIYNVATSQTPGATFAKEATGWAGAWAAGRVGAAVGTEILPGWGTLIGGAIGGALGYMGITAMFSGPKGNVAQFTAPPVDAAYVKSPVIMPLKISPEISSNSFGKGFSVTRLPGY